MPDPDFVSYRDAMVIFDELRITRFPSLPRLRDCNEDQIRSALAQPGATWEGGYLHASFLRMASVLLYHVTKAHACSDGNKRLAIALLDAFVKLNGWHLDVMQDELVAISRYVADSNPADREEVLGFLDEWLRDNLVTRRWSTS